MWLDVTLQLALAVASRSRKVFLSFVFFALLLYAQDNEA
jgi:hypothetical protein